MNHGGLLQSVMILHPLRRPGESTTATAISSGVIYTRKRGDLCCAGRESSVVTSRTITREVSFSKEARSPRNQRGVVRPLSLPESTARSITILSLSFFLSLSLYSRLSHSYFSFEHSRAPNRAAPRSIRSFLPARISRSPY